MTDPTTQAAVERLIKLSADTRRLAPRMPGLLAENYARQEADAIDTVLADHTRQAERIKELEGHLEAIAHGENLLKLTSDDAEAKSYNEGVGVAHSLAARARRALSATPPAAPSLPAWKANDLAIYTSFGIRVEIVGPVEGWWEVRFIDGSTAIVRPSSLTAIQSAMEKADV